MLGVEALAAAARDEPEAQGNDEGEEAEAGDEAYETALAASDFRTGVVRGTWRGGRKGRVGPAGGGGWDDESQRLGETGVALRRGTM